MTSAPQITGFGFERPNEGGTNDWLTPPKLVAMLGEFDLDPCGCVGQPWILAKETYYPSAEMNVASEKMEAARRIKDKRLLVVAAREYDLAAGRTEHGLNLPWSGRVFCNPPYGPHISKWAQRMAEHRNGIFLIFSRTETDAWLGIWETADAFLFPHGRTCFYLPSGIRAKSGTAPSCLIAYGQQNVEALKAAQIAGAFVGRAEQLTGTKISRL